jgi:hypothetical protein
MLPYFKRSETFIPGTGIRDNDDLSKSHGFSGPIKVSQRFRHVSIYLSIA